MNVSYKMKILIQALKQIRLKRYSAVELTITAALADGKLPICLTKPIKGGGPRPVIKTIQY
jgi:hypothetical protein